MKPAVQSSRHFGMRVVHALVLSLCLASCRTGTRADQAAGDEWVQEARAWRQHEGMAAARDHLSVKLGQLDAQHGAIEHRLWRTNADKAFTWPDSLATLSRSQRERTGIFLVLGYRTTTGRSERVIRQVETFLNQRGWRAIMVDMPRHGTGEQDAVAIQDSLIKHLPGLERAIVVGFSKGGLDWMHWFAGPGHQLPDGQRQKIKLMLSFAAALRGAAVADWLVQGGGPVPASLRLWMLTHEHRQDRSLADLRSTAADPWAGTETPALKKLSPHLKCVCLVALPEGADGHTHADRKFSILSRLAALQWQWLGPVDGLVESAAEVLPAEAGLPQHIVRVLGSHSLLDGRYLNGGVVSRIYSAKGDDYWMGGEELLDDLLRALPKDWVW